MARQGDGAPRRGGMKSKSAQEAFQVYQFNQKTALPILSWGKHGSCSCSHGPASRSRAPRVSKRSYYCALNKNFITAVLCTTTQHCQSALSDLIGDVHAIRDVIKWYEDAIISSHRSRTT